MTEHFEDDDDAAVTEENAQMRARLEEEMGSVQVPEGYEVTIRGVIREDTGERFTRTPMWLIGLTRKSGDKGWKMLVQGWSRTGMLIEATVTYQELHGRASMLAARLDEEGFVTEVGQAKEIVAYLSAFSDVPHLIQVESTGWSTHPCGATVFVLCDRVIGRYEGDEYDLRALASSELARGTTSSGTLEQWRSSVGTSARGNPVIMFSIMLSLSNPLIWLVDGETGGSHLRGPSSTGKTTAVLAAASVWGPAILGGTEPSFILTCNTTANALERVAAARCDIALVLDEVGEFEGWNFGRIVYALSTGQGKTRMRADTSVREHYRWRFNYLSTGEKSVQEMLQMDGHRHVRAGQMVRLLNLETDGKIVVDTHGDPDPAEWVERLKAWCRSFYGVAGPAFIENLLGVANDQDTDPIDVGELGRRFDAITREITLPNLDGQQRRVIRRLALVATAGSLASEYGILPWTHDEAISAVSVVRDMWLRHCLLSDAARAIEELRDYIEQNLDKIALYSKDAPQMREKVGYRKRVDGRDLFLFTRSGFRRACGGATNIDELCRALLERGLLHCNNAPRYQSRFALIHELLMNENMDGGTFAKERINLYAVEAKILNYEPETKAPAPAAQPPEQTPPVKDGRRAW